MKETDHVQIAGKNTVGHWKKLKENLKAGEGWNEAYSQFFYKRLETRYFRPIRLIQGGSEDIGEGFAIVALQCSLIEYLASTLTGESYRPPAGPARCETDGCNNKIMPPVEPCVHEYTGSSKIFRDFLQKQKPFCGYFTSKQAGDFYKYVRCALLHEARTKGGWVIRTDTSCAIDADKKTINRNKLQDDFEEFATWYGGQLQLPDQDELRKAFIRKFDSLCVG